MSSPSENLRPTTVEEAQEAVADLMARIQLARESPLGLYMLMFTADKGKPVVIKEFHEVWNALVLNHKQFVISASRGLTKTSFMLAAACWILGRNPDIRIKWLSDDDDTAIKRLAVIHAVLDSQLFQWIFPGVRKLTPKESQEEKRPNSASKLNVKRNFLTPESTVEASGVRSAGTGGRADLIICDDVVSESNALLNPTMRPKVINKFLSDWLATLVPDGRVWYIGSPWHRDDLLGYLRTKTDWIFSEHKHGKPGNPYHSIFPELWPEEELKGRRRSLGPLHYARAYLCQPLHEGTIAVRPESLVEYTRYDLTPEILEEATVVISIDPSSGKNLEKGKLDFTGVTIFLFWRDDAPELNDPAPYKFFVVDSYQVMMPHVAQAQLVWQLVKEWEADYVIIEAVGMQSLHDWLEDQRAQNPSLPLATIEPISSGNMNKGQRLIRITPLLDRPTGEKPIVYFHPRAVDENPQTFYITIGSVQFEALRDFRGQILGFPAEHDDILDSFTYGLYWIHFNFVTSDEELSGGRQEKGASTKNLRCVSL